MRLRGLWPSVRYPLAVFVGVRLWYAIFGAALKALFAPQLFPDAYVRLDDWFSRCFLMPWQHWDTLWYLRLAMEGYGVPDGRSVFPPMYPLLIHALTGVLGNPLLAAMVVANLAAASALVLFYQLVRKELDEPSARIAILILVFFPTSVYLFSAFSEPLFLALALSVWRAGQRYRFGLASCMAALATLTRFQGVVLTLPLAWMIWQAVRSRTTRWASLVWSLLPMTALVVYYGVRLYWLDSTPIELVYQTNWRSSLGWPGESMLASLSALPQSFSMTSLVNWLDIGLLLGMMLLIPAIVRQLPVTYWLYHMGTLVVLLLRTGPPENPLQGMARYMLLMFPGQMILGRWAVTHGRGWVLLVPLIMLSNYVLVVFVLGLGWL